MNFPPPDLPTTKRPLYILLLVGSIGAASLAVQSMKVRYFVLNRPVLLVYSPTTPRSTGTSSGTSSTITGISASMNATLPVVYNISPNSTIVLPNPNISHDAFVSIEPIIATSVSSSPPPTTTLITTTTTTPRTKTKNKKETNRRPLPYTVPTELRTPYLNATNLLQSGHFDRAAKSIAKAYRSKIPQVCSVQRPERHSRSSNQPQIYKTPIQGIFYVKVPKAASSTLAGINRRIAIHWGRRLYGLHQDAATTTNSSSTIVLLGPSTNATIIGAEITTTCTHQEAHIIGAGRFYGNRDHMKSFLWASIRDPAARAMSRIYFYQISQGGKSDDDETILHFLKHSFNPQSGIISKGKGGFQLEYVAMNPMDDWFSWNRDYPMVVQRHDAIEERVKNVTEQYDFIVVTERMEESIVALQLLLGLRIGDVLSSSAKVGGGFYYRANSGVCIPIQKARRSVAVRQYLESDEWQAVNYGDYLLYSVANQSLDLTIERLGKERFHNALTKYQSAQQIVHEECWMETFYPCSDNGTVQLELSTSNCYSADEGCGYACMDRLIKERGW